MKFIASFKKPEAVYSNDLFEEHITDEQRDVMRGLINKFLKSDDENIYVEFCTETGSAEILIEDDEDDDDSF